MLDDIQRRGLMLVISSPSGAGKSSIARALLESDEQLFMSVSYTTRPPRPGEVSGEDYIFVDQEDFNIMVNKQEMLEHAEVFGNYYGTPKAQVEERLAAGQDVLFDIDWQGTQSLEQAASDDVVRVFILPPSTSALEQRLNTRAQDPPDVIAGRMSKAVEEISHWAEYDYVVVNEDLETAIESVRSVLRAERLRRERQPGLTEFTRLLRGGA